MARVVLTGATGAIGRALVEALRVRGDEVVALSRDVERAGSVLGAGVELHAWPDPAHAPPPENALANADAVVNLAGEPIAQRWSEDAKRKIRDSRVLGTRSLVAGLRSLAQEQRPRTLVSQSAIGYYGPRDKRIVDEQADPGTDFLAGVTTAWEQEALAAEPPMRVVLTRTGVVLSPGSGALAQMLPAFRLGLGGPIAGGRQGVSWIHIDDVTAAIVHALERTELEGPVNLTAPQPASNAELARVLGRVLGRPALLPVPGFALQLLYGDMSQIITTGQRVIPERLLASGYQFRWPELEAALRDVLEHR